MKDMQRKVDYRLNFNVSRDIGYILQLLFNGLRRLEYRGYDSAGISIDSSQTSNHGIATLPLVFRQEGNIESLVKSVYQEVAATDLNLEESFSIHAGIAHTRWATHGEPPPRNGHPQTSDPGNEFLVVHNGVITNYETCAGAVMLKDVIFWCLLFPFMTGANFQLTLLIGCMHSVNAVFLLLESALNRMTFPWFRLIYFVLWSCYIVFQWVLHACCFTWSRWSYPFLQLSTPWAPMWYLGLALVHIPCYALYVLVVKAKRAAFSRMFPHKFVR